MKQKWIIHKQKKQIWKWQKQSKNTNIEYGVWILELEQYKKRICYADYKGYFENIAL